MKKIKLDASKLQLKKERIVALTSEEMGAIKGGTALPSLAPCNPTNNTLDFNKCAGQTIDVSCTCGGPVVQPAPKTINSLPCTYYYTQCMCL